jgi:hypothetical protein
MIKIKYREFYGVIITLGLVLATLLSGCGGVAASVPSNSSGLISISKLPVAQVINGVKQVLTNAPGSAIMVKNNLVLIIWAEANSGYNFYVANTESVITMEQFLKAEGTPFQALNAKTYESFYDLKHQLVMSGWSFGGTKDVPRWLLVAMTSATTWAMSIGSSLPTFMFIPIVCDSLVGNVCGLQQPVKTEVSYAN